MRITLSVASMTQITRKPPPLPFRHHGFTFHSPTTTSLASAKVPLSRESHKPESESDYYRARTTKSQAIGKFADLGRWPPVYVAAPSFPLR
jgi:hypothetical protein